MLFFSNINDNQQQRKIKFYLGHLLLTPLNARFHIPFNPHCKNKKNIQISTEINFSHSLESLSSLKRGSCIESEYLLQLTCHHDVYAVNKYQSALSGE